MTKTIKALGECRPLSRNPSKNPRSGIPDSDPDDFQALMTEFFRSEDTFRIKIYYEDPISFFQRYGLNCGKMPNLAALKIPLKFLDLDPKAHDFQNSVGTFWSKDTPLVKKSLRSEQYFLPRYMECRCGLAMRILSVRLSVHLSVCLSNACIVTKRKKDLSRFLYHTKDHLA